MTTSSSFHDTSCDFVDRFAVSIVALHCYSKLIEFNSGAPLLHPSAFVLPE